MTSIKEMREMARLAYQNKVGLQPILDISINCKNKGTTHEKPIGEPIQKRPRKYNEEQ